LPPVIEFLNHPFFKHINNQQCYRWWNKSCPKPISSNNNLKKFIDAAAEKKKDEKNNTYEMMQLLKQLKELFLQIGFHIKILL